MRYALFCCLTLGTYLLSWSFHQLAHFGDLGYWLFALLNLPGTFLHELMHYLAALVLDGDPRGFTIIPEGKSLGSVMAVPNWWNAATIAFAPVLLLPMTTAFLLAGARAKTVRAFLGFMYLSTCSWIAVVPSSQDLKFALMFPSSFVLAAIILIPSILLSGRIALRALDSR